jgi:hypothetical protein
VKAHVSHILVTMQVADRVRVAMCVHEAGLARPRPSRVATRLGGLGAAHAGPVPMPRTRQGCAAVLVFWWS